MSVAALDWERCRSLLAILRTGSLSAAARSLGVAHPTMRRHLQDIESVVGSRLFVRSPRGLVATELALALRGPAETMEAAFGHLPGPRPATPRRRRGRCASRRAR